METLYWALIVWMVFCTIGLIRSSYTSLRTIRSYDISEKYKEIWKHFLTLLIFIGATISATTVYLLLKEIFE